MLYINDQELDTVVGYIAVLCLGQLCSGFIAIRCGQEYVSKGKQTSTVVRFLGIKAASDFIYNIDFIVYCCLLYRGKELKGSSCVPLGFVSQLCALADMTLNFLIAFDVYLLLLNPYTYDTKKWRNRMLIAASVLCFGTSFVLLGAGKLGNSGDGDCWVKNPIGIWSWCLYGPAYFYFFFCISAVLFFIYKVARESSVTDGDEIFASDLAKRMLSKMILFTFMYLCCWSLIILRHFLELNGVNPDKIPKAQGIAATFGSMSIGIWDLFVWYVVRSVASQCFFDAAVWI